MNRMPLDTPFSFTVLGREDRARSQCPSENAHRHAPGHAPAACQREA